MDFSPPITSCFKGPQAALKRSRRGDRVSYDSPVALRVDLFAQAGSRKKGEAGREGRAVAQRGLRTSFWAGFRPRFSCRGQQAALKVL